MIFVVWTCLNWWFTMVPFDKPIQFSYGFSCLHISTFMEPVSALKRHGRNGCSGGTVR